MTQIPLIKPLITACTILILLGCTTEEPPPTQSETPEAAPLSTLRPTIQTEATSPTAPDPTPSATITLETATALPTIAPPNTAAATLTPLPTLEGVELESAVAELLANPMNSDVPCWWGAVPGTTTVFEVEQFLTRHQLPIYFHRDENQIPYYIELLIGIDEEQLEYRVFYSFQEHVLNSLLVEHAPPPFEILRKYGEPDEIWLSTMSIELELLPVRFNLIYLEEGMGVSYTVDGDIEDERVIGCYADIDGGRLHLIKPNRAVNYGAFKGIFFLDFRWLQLEEATNLTMEDFIQQFSDPTQPQCIETPAELWE